MDAKYYPHFVAVVVVAVLLPSVTCSDRGIPDPPQSLAVRASSRAVVVTWTFSLKQASKINGFIIGYGNTIADEHVVRVQEDQRKYVIRNLQPDNEYVISLRAFNKIGQSRALYTETRTSKRHKTPLKPVVGIRTVVKSSTSIYVRWNDLYPGGNDRYYLVRCMWDKGKKYAKSTEQHVEFDRLAPNTKYEFSVKVIEGKRRSTYSLSAINTTLLNKSETPEPLSCKGNAPGNIVTEKTGSRSVALKWQPPCSSDGEITGYAVYYTDLRGEITRKWTVREISGSEPSVKLHFSKDHKICCFKVQAIMNKEYSHMSPIKRLE